MPMRLIDQTCWNKITYIFGLIGPEICFFCHEDQITQALLPDLDPFTI